MVESICQGSNSDHPSFFLAVNIPPFMLSCTSPNCEYSPSLHSCVSSYYSHHPIITRERGAVEIAWGPEANGALMVRLGRFPYLPPLTPLNLMPSKRNTMHHEAPCIIQGHHGTITPHQNGMPTPQCADRD